MNSYEIIDVEQLEAERAAAARKETIEEFIGGIIVLALLGLMFFLAMIGTDYYWC